MNKEFTEKVCTVVLSANLNDWDQRSAIGVATTWLNTGRFNGAVADVGLIYQGRDALAREIIAVLEQNDNDKERRHALREARARLNAPFQDPTMAAYRSARAKAGPVGSEKKGEKMGLSPNGHK